MSRLGFVVVTGFSLDTGRHADIFDNSPYLHESVGQISVYFAVTGDIMFFFPVRQVYIFIVRRSIENYLLSCDARLLPRRLSTPYWSHFRSTSCFAMPPVRFFLS